MNIFDRIFSSAKNLDSDQDFLSVLNLDLENGPWFTGGAAIEFYKAKQESDVTHTFRHQNDIDIFFQSIDDAKKALTNLKKIFGVTSVEVSNSKYKRLFIAESKMFDPIKDFEDYVSYYSYQNKPVKSVKFKIDGIDINFIIVNDAFLEDILHSFDFTVCQIATDGENFKFGNKFHEDLKNRTLDLSCLDIWENTKIQKRKDRVNKYIEKGYKPSSDLIEYMLREF